MTSTGAGARSERPGVLTDARAPRVRALARLAERSARRKTGTFLAEGPQPAREALAPGSDARVRALYLTQDADRRHPELKRFAVQRAVAVHWVDEQVVAAIAGTRTPQGVVAVCDLTTASLEHAATAVAAQEHPLLVVLAEVSDPGNAGTVVRTADAAGAGAVVLTTGSVDIHNPKSVRSSAGSVFHLPVVQAVSVAESVAAARGAGLAVLAASAAPGASALDDLADAAQRGAGPLAGGVAWVFGNEAHGLDAGACALADLVVAAPLHGRAESLNLAAAAAVCLYATARAQRRAFPGARGAAACDHTGTVKGARSAESTPG